ncbi:MAG: CheR family methyltransferase [Bacteroidales bacterium]
MIELNNTITELLIKEQGIDISKYDTTFLNNSIQKRISEKQCNTLDEYYTLIEQNNKEAKRFIDSLQISYSEFFRNSLTFSVLERIVLPSLFLSRKVDKKKEIRIWSAASASGQEAYSLAILIEEIKNANCSNCKFRIFATDQSEEQLLEAKKGNYKPSALNNMNIQRLKQWFTKQGKTYTIKSELKENIDFSVFDLLNEQYSSPPVSIFGDFGIVLCANLLFYYKPEFQKQIMKKITHSLADDGYLITGEAEREIVMNHNYHEIYPQSAIFQKNR